MPVPFVNFMNMPTGTSPISALVPGIDAGLELSANMQKMHQKKKEDAIKNALAKLQLDQYPDKSAADLENKKAMTGYYNAMSGAVPEKNDIARSHNELLLEQLRQKLSAPSAIEKANATADYKDQLKNKNTSKADLAKMIQDATGESEISNNLQNYGKAFDTSYNKTGSYERGSFLGYTPAISSAAQDTDRNSNLMVSQILNLLKGGRVTNSQLSFLQTLKPSRLLNPESEKNAISQISGGASRGAEHLPFIMYAQQKGMSPNDIRSLWAKYASEKPVYNAEKGIINNENLNSWKKYVDEFTKSGGNGAPVEGNGYALDNNQVNHLAQFLGQSGADTKTMGGNQKAAAQVNVPQAAAGKIIIRDSDGDYHQISPSKLEKAKEIAKKQGRTIEVISNGQ